ncbi:MAG: type II secretion system F family protein [Mycobacterium sp.]
MNTAALLLASALLIAPGSTRVRQRAGSGPHRDRRGAEIDSGRDPFAGASALDVLAVCLGAGMTVAAAAAATAGLAPPALRALLRRSSDLLALGADSDEAWQVPQGAVDENCDALVRLARRTASSGSAMAAEVAALAERQRGEVGHAATAAAERAGVLIAGPLGLCFLPAFICLGLVPVVAGLAGGVFGAVLG